MAIHQIKLRHLRCFLSVFRAGGISAASEALALSQPAVTKTLNELESILGSKLIVRGRGSAKLTIQGEVFMPRAAACLMELERAVESVSAADSKLEWHVHVGAMPSTETSLVPAAVRLVQREVPAAVVKISTGPLKYLADLLLDNKIDLIVGHMPSLDQMVGLSFQHLYAEPFHFVVRREHPLTENQILDVSTLKRYEMILPENSPSDNAHVARLLTSIGLTDNISDRIVAMAPGFMRACLLDSDAICVVPEGVFKRELASGELVALNIDTSHSSSAVGVIVKTDAPFKPAVEVMTRAFHAVATGSSNLDRLKP